ncbi:MAG: DUF3039 domain-containing protein [Acidimicrobiia bacterium]|nr:DUF3039 domain-containing protein [Acidimicrobiia bacterium]MDH3462468.1 DUF3039 domain-containing protein [Acidimicrobiia bacterium]
MTSQINPNTTVRPNVRTTGEDSEAVAHIVMKKDQMRGYVAGQAVRALCGKVWVPSRDYEGLPVCEVCQAEKQRILAGMKGMN